MSEKGKEAFEKWASQSRFGNAAKEVREALEGASLMFETFDFPSELIPSIFEMASLILDAKTREREDKQSDKE